MRKPVIAGVILCLVLVGVISTLFEPDEVDKKTISTYVVGVVGKSGMSQYWLSVRRGMEVAAKETGIELLYMSPDAEDALEVQDKMVETMVRREVDAIAISPIDSFRTPQYFEASQEKGIPIISYDSPYQDASIPYIGIDNEKAGRQLGQALAEAIGHQGEIAVITGDLRQLGHRQRYEAFNKYMETESEIDIVYTESGYSSMKMSDKKIRELQEAYPDIKGILATSGVTAMGIVEGISGDSVVIASVDAQEDAMQAVEDGKINVLIAQSGYDIGHRTIKYIDQMRKGQQQEKRNILEAELLTPDNIMDYRNRNK